MDLFSKLPKDCIAIVISFTSPQDACQLSLIGPIFRSAADSDAVWEAFMPSDYKDIIAQAFEYFPPPLTTKELYFRLADTPLMIDHGTKSFSLEKQSGRKCFMLGARDLSIVWAHEPMYWRFKSLPESRFPEVAELLRVCWLEINGKIRRKMLSPNTLYGAYLIFKLTPESYGFQDQPMNISCGGISASETLETVFLDHTFISASNITFGKYKAENRRDGWLEIKLGEYFNLNGELDDDYLQMGLKEVRRLHWKYGLIVEGIEIRPESRSVSAT